MTAADAAEATYTATESAYTSVVTDSASSTTSLDSNTTTYTTSSASATDSASSNTTSTTTSTTASASATTSAAPGRRDLEARTNSVSCQSPSFGSSISLAPDFSASRHDFSQIVTVFVTFISGITTVSVAATISSRGIDVPIPRGLGGQTFIFITITDISGRQLSDSDVLFGPAILESEFLTPTQLLVSRKCP